MATQVDEAVDPLVAAYQRSYERIAQQLVEVAEDPRQWRRAGRLRETREYIGAQLEWLNREVAPRAAQATQWAAALGHGAGGGFSWTLADRQAAEVLARRLYTDLLSASELAEQTSTRLLRRLGRDAALEKLLEGQTAVQAGQAFARRARELGVYAVTYSDGSRHGLDEYAAMAMRTVTANAYNTSLISGAQEEGIGWFEVFDGPDCGLRHHDDSQLADGLVVDAATASAHPIAHPNCRRAFGPRPDVTSPEEAAEASRSTTREQREDQIAADRARGLAIAERADEAAQTQIPSRAYYAAERAAAAQVKAAQPTQPARRTLRDMSLTDQAQQAEVYREWFADDWPGGLKTTIQDRRNFFDGERGGSSGQIWDKDGKLVGRFVHGARRAEDGSMYGNLSILELDPSVQGQGFARAFNDRVENFYRSSGAQTMRLDANIDVGGYAWARAGYDFDWSDARTGKVVGGPKSVMERVADAARSAGDKDSEELVRGWLSSGARPTPFDVSRVGYREGATSWPGKTGMLGSRWNAIKRLT